ncbi:MAG: hypothetical protein A2X36_13810 [Elusimicrobia bacterium GWA2_69_24]|nr:MAG: hypothetical protein A2X36_13810 [Elusimicrobia bacterium GWA2_69_24]HBL18142.1 hypothetical protein [Elusimicrobiota bacterium]
MAGEVKIREALEFGWDTLLARLGPLLRLQALTVLLGFGPIALGEIVPGNLGYLLLVSGSLLQFWMALGWARVALKLAEGGEVSSGDLFADWRALPAFFASSFIVYLAVLIGLVFLVAPGAFLLSAWCLFPLVLAAEQAGPIAALRRSWRLSAGSRLPLLGLILLSILLAAAGLLACGFGIFLSAPVVAVAWARVYRDLASGA